MWRLLGCERQLKEQDVETLLPRAQALVSPGWRSLLGPWPLWRHLDRLAAHEATLLRLARW